MNWNSLKSRQTLRLHMDGCINLCDVTVFPYQEGYLLHKKDPDQLINKIVCYLIQVRRLQTKYNFSSSDIYAIIDETPVWEDMATTPPVWEAMATTTTVSKKGSKDAVMQSTGHEKARVIIVCLTAKADGCKKRNY